MTPLATPGQGACRSMMREYKATAVIAGLKATTRCIAFDKDGMVEDLPDFMR